MKNIIVERLIHTPVEEQEVEIVERKGMGHPDSIADGIAEAMSRSLSREYLKRCGAVLHHNTDETQIVAGRAKTAFGGGEVIQPIYILLVGRATKHFDGIDIPADKIALRAAKEYVKTALRYLDPETDAVFDVKLGEGSTDLKEVFQRKEGNAPLANDTSFGIGYAPLSETENLVLNIERRIYGEFRKKEKAIGEDVKVMGLREKNRIRITVACAFVDRHVSDIKEYQTVKDELNSFIKDISSEYSERDVMISVNTADNIDSEVVYLTVTGTSAENGDDGSVGRGNRCNGLITPGRPMSMEATSGKNPINHVGKIYNLLANQIAHDCYSAIEGIMEVYVRILSQIGKPIDEPKALSIQIVPEKGYDVDKMELKAKTIAEEWLNDITKITEMVISGEISTF